VPLYEFDCSACGAHFEAVVPAGCTAPCPACGGEEVTRAFPPIAASGVAGGLKKERFVAERKQGKGAGPPGG
jgi:putative FmdB family regulatory protein